MNHRKPADRYSGGAGPEPVTAGTATHEIFLQDLALQDLALFAHALMFKATPDRFNHRSGSACRLRF